MATEIDERAKAWLIAVARDHYWRVASWYEFSDLVQDGIVVWYRIVKHYETDRDRVRRRAHIMRLFKTSYLNHIHNLSIRRTKAAFEVKAIDALSPTDVDSNDDIWTTAGKTRDLGEYDRLIAEAPVMLKPLLRKLLADGPSLRMQAAYRVMPKGYRETLNERLCKIVGANPQQQNLAELLLNFLTP
jgi:hypothetical protein